MPRITPAAIVLSLSVATLTVGCSDPIAKIHMQRRTERADRWLAYSSAYEAGGWTRLGKTVDVLERLHRQTVERANQLPAEIAQWQKRDEVSFREKLPWHRAWITKSVNGNLGRARKSAILLTY